MEKGDLLILAYFKKEPQQLYTFCTENRKNLFAEKIGLISF